MLNFCMDQRRIVRCGQDESVCRLISPTYIFEFEVLADENQGRREILGRALLHGGYGWRFFCSYGQTRCC